MKKNHHIIFGCGYYGRAIFRKIKNKNTIFIDNNPSIQKCLNVKVLRPEDINKKKIHYKKIYLGGRYVDKQIPQLKDLGLFKKKKIFKNYELLPSKKNLIIREKKIVNILDKLFKEFNKNKIDYWVDRSSLLAVYRNQKFSEFSDVDISINITNYKSLSLVMKKFPKKYKVKKKSLKIKDGKKYYDNFYIKSSGNLVKHEPATIDLIYRKILNSKIKSLGINLKDVPLKLLKKKKDFLYNKLKIRVPKYSEKYLQFIYGKSWKIKAKYYFKSSRI